MFSDSRSGNGVPVIQPQRRQGVLRVGPLSLLHFPNAIILMFPAYDSNAVRDQVACWAVVGVLAASSLVSATVFQAKDVLISLAKCSRVAQGHRWGQEQDPAGGLSLHSCYQGSARSAFHLPVRSPHFHLLASP